MKLKTIAKLFGAVVEDDYGSPQRDTALPGWFRWYLDHMPVRENVYGTLIDIGLTGTQANVIIERIWPQVASIQQEAIDLAKAGNESGAIARLNEAASLAERLAREAAEHERLLGRGIEPEPPRRMEERDMAAQAAKADWPRQVVERDNYILINDYLGAGYAQANPELVETLVRIADDYLLARPDVAFDNLWAYTYDALKKMYPARRRGIEVGGAMKAGSITKMFGARERLQAVVTPDAGGTVGIPGYTHIRIGKVSRYDFYGSLRDHLGEYNLTIADCLPGGVEKLAKLFDDFAEEYWPIAQERWAGKPNSFIRASVTEEFHARNEGVFNDLLFGGKQPWEFKEAPAGDAEAEKGPFNFAWISNVARQIFEGLFQGKPPVEANTAFEAFLGKDLQDAWRVEDNKGLDYPAETMEWLPNALYKLAGKYEATVGPVHKTGGGIMPKLLSLRSILMAAASLGDLLSLLRKVKEPTKEVTAAIKKLEGMVAKYDEGAKLEDVNTATMKRILAQLKKIKPTKEHPRTRVLKAVKLLEDLLKTKVSSAVLQASIVQVARILKAVEEPTEEVKEAIKLADQLAKSYEEDGPQKYGKVVSVEGMTKLLKMLEAIEEKPDPVVKAVAALKKLLGAEEEKAPVAPGVRGELPSYGLAQLEAALKPGVYRARLIRAGEALDGTTWPEEQLKIAFEKGYFEGVPVNAISYTGNYGPDIEYHLPLDTEVAGKVVGNQVGFIKDAKWDDEEHAGYGYVYITEAERRNLIDAMLEQGIDAPGMSIYADGMKDENDIVTGINGVTSMDLVTFPAADGAILSQALTASVKEWGMLRKKLQAGEPIVAAVVPDAGGVSEETPETIRDWITDGWDSWDAWLDSDHAKFPQYVRDVEAMVQEGIRDLQADGQKVTHAMVNKLMSAAALKRPFTLEELAIYWGGEEKIPPAALEAYKKTMKETKTGGGIMSPTALEQRLDVVEKISQDLNERVAQADVDGMIELKLQASKLPDKVQVALRGQLLGKQLTEEEVDSFIKFQQGITDDLATELAATAHVTLGGGVLPGEGKETLEGALEALFEKQK